MYKTIWMIEDTCDEGTFKTEFTYYHFGKNPQFPTWYMEENHMYTIEMLWNFKLRHTPKLFIKCLLKEYAVKG